MGKQEHGDTKNVRLNMGLRSQYLHIAPRILFVISKNIGFCALSWTLPVRGA